MKDKIKAVGLAVTIVVTIVMSLVLHISLLSRNGGLLLLPIFYIALIYVLPYIWGDIFRELKKCFARENFCITKGALGLCKKLPENQTQKKKPPTGRQFQ